MVGRFNRPAAPQSPYQEVATLPGILSRGLKGSGHTGASIVEHAKNLLKEKATLKEIYNETGKMVDPSVQTGLRMNPAGQWVTNITDKDMKLTPYAESAMYKSGGTLGGIPLKTAVKHDLLYDFLPDIQNTPVNLEQTVAGSADLPWGAFNPPGSPKGGTTGMIQTMGRGAPNDLDDPFSQRNILAHEIDHLIANNFNMPAGANPGMQGRGESPGLRPAFQQQVIPQANKLRDFLLKERDKFLKQYPNDPNGAEMWRRMFPDQADALQQAIYVGGGKLPGQATVWPPDKVQFEYEGTAGEQGSRMNQQMSGMSAEEMQADSPYFKKSDWVLTNPIKPKQPEFLIPALQSINMPNAKGGLDWWMPDLNFWKNNLDVKR